jgi:hypothetical protein
LFSSFILVLSISFDELCFVDRHLMFAIAVGITQIILYAVGMPLIVYIFLWRHRHELDKPVVKFRYGLFFAGFRQEKYYWECIVALRKESTVILAVFGPQMGVAMLAHVALLVFMVQVLVQLVGSPYGAENKKLQVLDVGAICICWGTMWSGFFFYTPRPPEQKYALMVLTMVVVLVNIFYMLVLLCSICTEACKEHENSLFVQVFRKRTSRLRLGRMSSSFRVPESRLRTASRVNRDAVHVSNPVQILELTEGALDRVADRDAGKDVPGKSYGLDSNVFSGANSRVHENPMRTLKSKAKGGAETLMEAEDKEEGGGGETSEAAKPAASGSVDESVVGLDYEIYVDDNGRRYWWNPATGETAWLDQ